VDNRDQVIGRQVDLYFGQRHLCPSADSPPGQPVIEVANGGQSNGLSSLSIDLSATGPCPSERPAVVGWDGGVLGIGDGELVGWSGWAIASGLFGEPARLLVTGTSLRSGSGFAIHSGGGLMLAGSELVGNELPPSTHAPGLVWLEPNVVGSTIRDVLFLSNLVHSDQALVAGPAEWMDRLAFVGNGLTEQASLLSVGYGPWPYEPEAPLEQNAERGLADSVVVGNRRLLVPEDFEMPSWPSRVSVAPVGPSCIGGPALAAQVDPFVGLEQGPPGPLIVVDPIHGYPAEGGFLIARTFFVDNDSGTAPLVEARLPSGLSLQFVHNTFGANLSVPIVGVLSAGTSTALVVLRNLLDESDGAPIQLPEAPSTLIVSMNAALSGEPWTSGLEAAGSTQHLIGPDLDSGELELLESGNLASASPCQQFSAVCPASPGLDCATWSANVGSLPCPLLAASHWVPDPSVAASPWPWDTGFFGDGDGGSNLPGATGGVCGNSRAALDRNEGSGDGDGYPDAVDCDNNDPDVVPILPERNGIDTADCDPAGSNCWICPDGTLIDDDDSAETSDDDDDSAEAEPDPTPTPAGTEGTIGPEPGCGNGGCGFAWSCADEDGGPLVALVLLLPAASRRRL